MWILIFIIVIVAFIWIVAIYRILSLVIRGIYYIIFDRDGGVLDTIKKTPRYKAFEKELDNLIKK